MAAGTRASEFLNRNSEREHLDALLRADAVPRVTFTDPQAAAVGAFPTFSEIYLAALKALHGEIATARPLAPAVS